MGRAKPQGISSIIPANWLAKVSPGPFLSPFSAFAPSGIFWWLSGVVMVPGSGGHWRWGRSLCGRSHHRVTESQNRGGWKSPLRSSRPTVPPTPPRLPNRVPKGHVHTAFEPLQGRGLPHCPGQPGPRLHNSFSEEIFPGIQFKPPLTQPEAVASRPLVPA